MKFIVNAKEFSDNETYPELKTMLNCPISEKKEILDFLKSFESLACMAHGVKDYVEDVYTSHSVQLFKSGNWYWTNEMVYHFEKYDLKLKDEFVKYVLSKKQVIDGHKRIESV